MLKALLRITYTFLILSASLATQAQSSHTLSGKVLDEQGDPLIGATVVLSNTNDGTITNLKGEFTLKGIKSSSVSITVSFLGYEPSIIVHDFSQGASKPLSVKLKPSSQNIDQVVVTGESSGQTKAMVQQQKAENIKNIVSAEQIEQFPDMNAAEAMQRITGITLQRDQGEGKYVQLRGTPPELTNFNINGEQIPSPEGSVRYVGMNIISADQIETIEVNKVLTPDMDGDGIAGSVNVVTKKAKEGEPEIKASVAAGYSDLRGTPNYNMQFSYGARKGKLGFQMNASYYQNASGSDNLESKYVKGPFWGSQSGGIDNYHLMYKQLQLRYYETERSRTGLSATLDYQFNPKHEVYLRGMLNQFTDKQTRSRKIYEMDDAIDMYYYLYGNVAHDVKSRTKNQELNTLNIGGKHDLNFLILDYELALSQAKEDVPDRLITEFQNPGQALTISLEDDGSGFIKPSFPDAADDSIATDYANYEFDKLDMRTEEVRDNNLTAKVNVKIPFTLGNNEGYFKLGAKMRNKDKSRDVTAHIYNGYVHDHWTYYPSTRPYDELLLTDISSGLLTDNLLGQGYRVEQIPDADKMRDFYNYNAFHFRYGDKADTESRSVSNNMDYTARELIRAYYAMFRFDLPKLMLLGGLRYESTDMEYHGKYGQLNENDYYDTTITRYASRHRQFVLPQFQVKYSPSDRFNVRGALTYSFSRPNFEDVLPNLEIERDEYKFGNPDLEYPLAMNIDVMVERYLNHNGILSGGLFYKNIENFVVNYATWAHIDEADSGGSPVEITVPKNGYEAFVYGAEFQAQFKLAFLPYFFKDFGVYSNYAFTHSDALIDERPPANYTDLVFDSDTRTLMTYDEELDEYVPMNSSTTEHIKLPGQAKHSANFALFYEGEKFYAKVSANYHDSYLLKLGADKDLDEYISGAWQMDFTTSYQFNKYVKAFVDVMNITNTPETSYLGSTSYLKKQEYYSWWGRVGIKLNL